MKFLITFLFSLTLIYSNLEAQELTIEETLKVINGYFKENSVLYTISIDSSYKLTIFYNGRHYCSSYIENLHDKVDVKVTGIVIYCIYGSPNYNDCIKTSSSSRYKDGHSSDCRFDGSFNTRYLDKISNAMQYLIAKAKSERLLHLQPDNDPFASPVPFYNQTISGKLPLIRTDGGLYLIPIILNQSIKQNFILDSGASEITINKSIFNLLQSSGSIKDSDILQPAYYQIADGSKVLKRRVNIKELRIGNYIINNIIASVSEDDEAPLLLGQSVLKKLGTISIDYTNHQLIIK